MRQEQFFYDPNMFIFSFESHGRCNTPQWFPVKEEKKRYKFVHFFKDYSDGWFVEFGTIGFNLGNEKSSTYSDCISTGHEGIGNTTLTGNTHPARFICTRIVAIHLE